MARTPPFRRLLVAAYSLAIRIQNAARRRLFTITPLSHLRKPPPASRNANRSLSDDVQTALCQTGAGRICAQDFSALLASAGPESAQALTELVAAARRGGVPQDLSGEDLLEQQPQVYRIGLNPSLLDLASSYIGRPCFYLGAKLKCDMVEDTRAGARQWHLDVEDERILRVLVYLNDVVAGGGPFEYFSRSDTERAQATLGYRSGYISDQDMAALGVEGATPQPCGITGRAGDVIVFDGARLMHRAQPPRISPRCSVIFHYTSRTPLELRLSARLSRSARSRLCEGLTPAQRASLPPARLV